MRQAMCVSFRVIPSRIEDIRAERAARRMRARVILLGAAFAMAIGTAGGLALVRMLAWLG